MRLGPTLLAGIGLWAGQAAGREIEGLRPIGTVEVPPGAAVSGMLYGGISGMAYDAANDRYVLLSDDKSEKAPARFYTAHIDFDSNGMKDVDLLEGVPIRSAEGRTFPKAGEGGEVLDPEALALDPRDGTFLFASEGDPKGGFDASIRRMAPDGRVSTAIPLPEALRFSADKSSGPRPNNTIEGLAFDPAGRGLWVALEAPLIQDGPVATLEAGGLTRIIRLDEHGTVQAAYAYPIDPVQAAKTGQFSDNGVSEILAVDADTLLVLERSGVQARDGSWAFYIRLYRAELAGATDIKDRADLKDMKDGVVTKTLLMDFNKAGIGHIDNLEAMTWGKPLKNGRRSLVLASDNNFDPNQVNQVMVFEVLEP